MRNFKLYLYISLALVLFYGCKSEDCPGVDISTLTFNFTSQTITMSGATPSSPVNNLQLVLRDGHKGTIYGPFMMDMSKISTNGSGVNYAFSISQAGIPFGSYEVWVWGNITDQSVLSVDSFTLTSGNNSPGEDYLLGKMVAVDVTSRQQSVDMELNRVTSKVTTSCTVPIAGRLLRVSGVYRTLAADGVYGESVDPAVTIDIANYIGGIPPQTIYVFPTIYAYEGTGSEFYLSWGTSPTYNNVQYAPLVAGTDVSVGFDTAIP